MAINPIVYTDKVVRSFLKYQLTTYPLADPRLYDQMREQLRLERTRATPLLRGPYIRPKTNSTGYGAFWPAPASRLVCISARRPRMSAM